jgi:glycerol-3-phosphate acyltransferase PlsY
LNIYAKFFAGIDPREYWAHSTGTTNILRSGNKNLALMTLVSDVINGCIITAISWIFFNYETALIFSFFCVMG